MPEVPVTIDLSELASPLLLLLIGLVGYLTRQAWDRVEKRLDGLEAAQSANTGRLIRIETKLGIADAHDPA